MRRLARRLFTLCSAVSLLLCVAVCVLWVRSARFGDRAHIVVPAGGRYWCLMGWSYQYTCQFRLTGAQDRPSYHGKNPWVDWFSVSDGARYDVSHRSAPFRAGWGRFVIASYSGTSMEGPPTNARYHISDWTVSAPHWFAVAALAVP